MWESEMRNYFLTVARGGTRYLEYRVFLVLVFWGSSFGKLVVLRSDREDFGIEYVEGIWEEKEDSIL